MDIKPQRPDCNLCTHFFITHEAHFRYGCRALDFKSKRLPILDVIDASGEPCHFFQAKNLQVKRDK
jgi:hypothetical protein